MTDTTNPRAEFDRALAAMRHTKHIDSTARVTLATVACAEALALLVDAHLPTVEPESEAKSDLHESLPDNTPVGHGWVVDEDGNDLFKPEGSGWFTEWIEAPRMWGLEGNWHKAGLSDLRPATVGDLRRVGLPVDEWPDITATEPEPVEPPTCWDEWEAGDVWAWGDIAYRMGEDRVLRLATHGGTWVPAVTQPGGVWVTTTLSAPTEEHVARVAAADAAAHLDVDPRTH